MTGAKAKRPPIEITLSPEHLQRMSSTVQSMIDDFPIEISRLTVSEYAAANRVLPTGTPFPGRWRNELTPFMVEIMDCLSARSETEKVVFIKCSQIGATASVENFVAYCIDVAPGPIMYVSSKEDLIKKWIAKRFTPLIKSCGLEDKIYKQHALKRSRATGNQMMSKEFPGGSIDVVSAQSESNLRQDSIRYLVMDEAGAYPWSVSGMGDPIEIAIRRTANWGSRRRIFIPSTPGVEGECRMLPLYQQGDQRRYFLPCPDCGGYFVLRFASELPDYYDGIDAAVLHYDIKHNRVDPKSLYVQCPHCDAKIPESARYNLIQAGEWRPTAEPEGPEVRSYQIGRLYSLMDNWKSLAELEVKSQDDPLVQQTFANHVAGWPYRETTQRPDKQKVYELRGFYGSGEIPTEQVLFLTAAVDVQQGSVSDPDKPPRLEMEICGWGYAYRTWSLRYEVFVGPVSDPYAGAWQKLYEFMADNKMECKRRDGFKLSPRIVFIDAGDGNTETVVFDFCARVRGCVPCKGAAELLKTKAGKQIDAAFDIDEHGPRERDRFRVTQKHDQPFVLIQTNWYKNIIWRSLKIQRQQGDEQRPRFMEFPRDYPDKYFDMLVAEERRKDGSFWKPSGRANESLDLRVYNSCAADYWLFLEVQKIKRDMISRGYTREQAECTRTRHIIDMYTKMAQSYSKNRK